jgi:HSP20 family protein
MTLMRFDPLRSLDRLGEQLVSGTRAAPTMPMEAFRRGDEFVVAIDVPGVASEDLELTVERNVVNVRATRRPIRREGDEVVADERLYGEFSRQLFLGDNLDLDKLEATCERGVLTVTVPVSEASRPRRISVGGESEQRRLATGQPSNAEGRHE